MSGHRNAVLVLRIAITGFLCAALLAACASHTDALRSQLPSWLDGYSFDHVAIIDDGFLSGHAVDDVLADLGKTRSDAAAVFKTTRNGSASIGAIFVSGIDGQRLLQSTVDHWSAPGMIDRTEESIGGKSAWLLTSRTGDVTGVYRRADDVFLVMSLDRSTVEALLSGMP